MMKSPRFLFAIFLVFAVVESGFAQQKPVVSQYMFSGLLLNPAYAGRHEYTSFTAMYRDQWVNMPGAPKLTTFTGQTGYKGRKVGTGFLVSEDKIGVHSNLATYVSYSYAIEFPNGGKFSMGLQGGVDILRSDWSKLTLFDQGDPSSLKSWGFYPS